MLISKNCVDMVKGFEGFSATVYKDIVGVPTLGYGMTGAEIKGLTRVTEVQASEMLKKLIDTKYAFTISTDLDAHKVKLNQNEFDALVSMAYNIGVGGLLGSTLYKHVCLGIRIPATITADFQMWSKAGGKVVQGLLNRRTKEAKLFLTPIPIVVPISVKENYCKKFQVFYNKATQTGSPISEDGVYGATTQKAFDKMQELIKGV